MKQRELIAFFCGLGLAVLPCAAFLSTALPVRAASSQIEDLQSQIKDRNAKLADIEAEIAKYQNELTKVGAQKDTLQKAINQLELARKKVEADISYTENKIGATNLEISQLDIEIKNTEDSIAKNEQAIGQTLQQLNEADQHTLMETVLANNNIADVWNEVDQLDQVRSTIHDQVQSLVSQKSLLEDKRTSSADKRTQLVSLKSQYTDQNQVLTNTKSEKNKLLTETKNQESNYQSLLAERQAAKEQFEKEINDLEAKLQFILDPNSIPPAGTQVFNWPLDSIRITQYFGDTAFARTAAYHGHGHNGVDFGASIGTPVKAVLAGTVIAVNTQVATMCQYGKWVLIRHANGLTTLYAHLSVVSVNNGAQVSTGQVVGYSGDTGYATGPHLHLSVFASNAVQFTQYTCHDGTTLTIPVSAFTGYLNPLDYLPPVP